MARSWVELGLKKLILSLEGEKIMARVEPILPENYTHVSGIYSDENTPKFLSFLDNVWLSPPSDSSRPSEHSSYPVADARSTRFLKSLLAARIPAVQSPVVWSDEELLP